MQNYNFVMVAADTDGIAFRKPDGSTFSKEERARLVTELNALMDQHIRWGDDGLFPGQLVIKTKNYALLNSDGKIKIKGSALKATTKEKALQKFVRELIESMLRDDNINLGEVYFRYAREIMNLKDISQWCSKHTVTKAVLTSKETTQVRLREALKGKSVQEGDKFYTFFETDTKRTLLENFSGVVDKDILLRKLFDTMKIFETVLDMKDFPNLSLKRNIKLKEALIEVPNAPL